MLRSIGGIKKKNLHPVGLEPRTKVGLSMFYVLCNRVCVICCHTHKGIMPNVAAFISGSNSTRCKYFFLLLLLLQLFYLC
jgi:hypothetical protein